MIRTHVSISQFIRAPEAGNIIIALKRATTDGTVTIRTNAVVAAN